VGHRTSLDAADKAESLSQSSECGLVGLPTVSSQTHLQFSGLCF